MALLEVRDLAVGIRRGKKILYAVNGIDVTIEAGEIVALAGESGCGKTLTALAITGLLPPAARVNGGGIRYNGVTIDTQAEASGEIAIIFQEPRQSLNPLIRVGPQIAEALELQGTDKQTAHDAALDILQKLKLPQPEKTFSAWPHQLDRAKPEPVPRPSCAPLA